MGELWDSKQNADVISKTFYDDGKVIDIVSQDFTPIVSDTKGILSEFSGYKSDVANLVAKIPINLHLFWVRTEGYDFTDFTNNPWSKTVAKMKEASLQHFFTAPNGGHS